MKAVLVFVDDYMEAVNAHISHDLGLDCESPEINDFLCKEREKAQIFAISMLEAGEKYIDSVSNVVKYYEKFLTDHKEILKGFSNGCRRN
ncbi:hypothetical protein QJV45_02640 [Listeria booriae]|uniref:hypothetical protein n=1 Tax=Listeria booriae TaxID=1552123 RepID=UPI0028805C91|nr:hypothetical protein [Listeria booriae]MDT0109340.1 hypothetical protein [Listeria booriae]